MEACVFAFLRDACPYVALEEFSGDLSAREQIRSNYAVHNGNIVDKIGGAADHDEIGIGHDRLDAFGVNEHLPVRVDLDIYHPVGALADLIAAVDQVEDRHRVRRVGCGKLYLYGLTLICRRACSFLRLGRLLAACAECKGHRCSKQNSNNFFHFFLLFLFIYVVFSGFFDPASGLRIASCPGNCNAAMLPGDFFCFFAKSRTRQLSLLQKYFFEFKKIFLKQ